MAEDLDFHKPQTMSCSTQAAESYGNDPNIEAMWAMKAYEHAQVYFNVLCSVDPKFLKLTPHDDLIYEEFTKCFSGLNLQPLNIDDLKSVEAKEKWRPFCNSFENVVEDFNFGTLLRINADHDYTEENSLLVTRIQFYAIEIARNRNGFNDNVREKFKASKPSS